MSDSEAKPTPPPARPADLGLRPAGLNPATSDSAPTKQRNFTAPAPRLYAQAAAAPNKPSVAPTTLGTGPSKAAAPSGTGPRPSRGGYRGGRGASTAPSTATTTVTGRPKSSTPWTRGGRSAGPSSSATKREPSQAAANGGGSLPRGGPSRTREGGATSNYPGAARRKDAEGKPLTHTHNHYIPRAGKLELKKKGTTDPPKSATADQADGENDADDDDDDDDDDEEEDIEAVFPPVSFLVLCPFSNCPDDTLPLTQPSQLTNHLNDCHGLVFKNIQHMVFSLQKYLDSWAEKLQAAEADPATLPAGVATTTSTTTVVTAGSNYLIDASQCPADLELRTDLQKGKLNEILQTQARERQTDSPQSRKCLFCKQMCENRYRLFRHMFTEHNFNIGLPDNLVDVNEFLTILETKLAELQCLYCEKTFTSTAVLRKHMRKKKHFKISARNRLYDRFYIVNFLEPGKNWENFENEVYDSEEERRPSRDRKQPSANNNTNNDDLSNGNQTEGGHLNANLNDDDEDGEGWGDWQEDDTSPENTMCLFDNTVAASPADACDHMREAHGFDLPALRRARGLDFYQTIRLINFIRRQTGRGVCMACDTEVAGAGPEGSSDSITPLAKHMAENGCFTSLPAADHPFWEDVQYLFPTYENDPLLMWFDDSWSDEEAEEAAAEVETEPKEYKAVQADVPLEKVIETLAQATI